MKRPVTMLLGALAVVGMASGAVPARAAIPSPATLAAAKTPADHEAIAEDYLPEARSLEKLALVHRDLAKIDAESGGKPWEAAQAKRKLAAEHEQMASSLAK